MKEPCEDCERNPDTCPYRPKGGVVTVGGCNPIAMDKAAKAFRQRLRNYLKEKLWLKTTT